MGKGFILDASVTIRWALKGGSTTDLAYADNVLDALENETAIVPTLWYTEIIHVLRCSENDGLFGESAFASFLYRLGQLPIVMDQTTPAAIMLAVAAVSREFKLSGYDAQYLELARRRNIAIATLDKDLRKAAKKAGVPVFLMK